MLFAAIELWEQKGPDAFTLADVGKRAGYSRGDPHQVWPTTAVYSATKYAVWAITEGLRQEHPDIRATIISPGVVESELADTITDPTTAAAIQQARRVALKADVIARAICYAIEEAAEVGVNEIIVRPMGGAF